MKLAELINDGCDFAYRVDWPAGEVLRIDFPSALIFYRDDDPALDLRLSPVDITADDWKCGEHISAKEEKNRRRAERKLIATVRERLTGEIN